MTNNQKRKRPRSDFEAPLVTDFSEGEEFVIGDKQCIVTQVTVEKQGAQRAFIEYECDDPDCSLRQNNHRLYEQALRRWYKSTYLRKDN